jgi:hypothetical protein
MQRAANSNLVEAVHNQSISKLTIRTMPDPEDIYSTALGINDISNSSVHIPNICNGNGDIITPNEYEKKTRRRIYHYDQHLLKIVCT